MGARGPQLGPRGRARLVRKAIKLLTSGVTITGTCDAVGIARETLYIWARQEPRLRAALIAPDEFRQLSARQVATAAAADVLKELARLAVEATDERTRVKAAEVLLPYGLPEAGEDNAGPVHLQVVLGGNAPVTVDAEAEVDALPERKVSGDER